MYFNIVSHHFVCNHTLLTQMRVSELEAALSAALADAAAQQKLYQVDLQV